MLKQAQALRPGPVFLFNIYKLQKLYITRIEYTNRSLELTGVQENSPPWRGVGVGFQK